MSKRGLLLVNVGTPEKATTWAVWRFLKAFLQDPRVIDLPSYLRLLLLYGVILPFRSKKTAKAYQKIWTPEGSPLMKNMQALTHALQKKLGDIYQVDFAMRYGKPSIASVLKQFKECDDLKIIPLFPQYASASSGSAIEMAVTSLSKEWNIPRLSVQQDFYNDAGFIRAYADIIRQHLANKSYDILLFSYHGLPERHINKSKCRANCDHVNACPGISEANRFCYRAQCYATTRLIAEALGLKDEDYAVAFQSRLGRIPWIKPYTDVLLPTFIAEGKKNIAVVCPSFVSDCLETLEEINIRARETWKSLGGNDFIFIPCLNDADVWVSALADMALNLSS